MQIQQRQHLGDLGGLAAPRRQNRRGKPLTLARVRVDATVVHPGRGHLDRSGAGQHLPGLVTAVAHHQPPTVLITLINELRDIRIDLRLQRLSQHPPGTLTHQLINHRARLPHRAVHRAILLSDRPRVRSGYPYHRSYLPDPAFQRRSCLSLQDEREGTTLR